MSKNEVESILKELEIFDISTIHHDLSVDVNGDVNIGKSISTKKAGRLLINFNQVSGDFNCNYCMLTTLVGSPKSCRNFTCSGNKLKTLDGAPVRVNDFSCTNNKGVILKGAPKIINGNCEIINCELPTLKGLEDTEIQGNADFSCNKLKGIIDVKNIIGRISVANNNITYLDVKLLESGKVDASDNPVTQDNIETSHFW